MARSSPALLYIILIPQVAAKGTGQRSSTYKRAKAMNPPCNPRITSLFLFYFLIFMERFSRSVSKLVAYLPGRLRMGLESISEHLVLPRVLDLGRASEPKLSSSISLGRLPWAVQPWSVIKFILSEVMGSIAGCMSYEGKLLLLHSGSGRRPPTGNLHSEQWTARCCRAHRCAGQELAQRLIAGGAIFKTQVQQIE